MPRFEWDRLRLTLDEARTIASSARGAGCRELLSSGLHAKPSAETEALYRRVLAD